MQRLGDPAGESTGRPPKRGELKPAGRKIITPHEWREKLKIRILAVYYLIRY